MLELLVQLRRQRLIVRQHQRRLADLLDDIRSGECLSGARSAHERLKPLALAEPIDELLNGFRLIAGRLVIADELKFRSHGRVPGAKEVLGVGYYTREQIGQDRSEGGFETFPHSPCCFQPPY